MHTFQPYPIHIFIHIWLKIHTRSFLFSHYPFYAALFLCLHFIPDHMHFISPYAKHACISFLKRQLFVWYNNAYIKIMLNQ